MANTLKFKRGLLAGLPTAAEGEPLFTTDTADLYIGTSTGTQKFQKFIASGTTSQLLRGDGSLLTMPIVLTSPSNGQVLKYNGTSWVNDSDAGITGSGTTNFLPKFTGATTLGNSLIWDNGTNVGIGTTSASFRLDIRSTTATIASVSGGSSTNQGSAYYVHKSNVASGSLTAYGDEAAITGGTPDLAAMIFTSASIPLKFYLNGALRMTLNDSGRLLLGSATDNGLRFQVTGDGYFSGRLGIGTASPTSMLDIIQSGATAGISVSGGTNPQMRATDGTITAKVQSITGLAAYIGTESNHQLRLIVNNSPLVYLFTTTNVSVGSSSDTGEKLQVNGTMRVSGASTFNANTTLTGAGLMNHQIISTSTAGYSYSIYKNTGASGREFTVGIGGSTTSNFSNKFFIFDTTADQPRIIIDSTGNVGMGTYTPAQRLDVQGAANSTQARFGNIAGRGLTIGTNAVAGTNDAGVILNAPTATDGTLKFQTSSVDRLTLSATASTFSTSVTSTQFNLSALNTAPATSSSTGTLGEIRIDADHIYVCTATNTWKRVAISTF